MFLKFAIHLTSCPRFIAKKYTTIHKMLYFTAEITGEVWLMFDGKSVMLNSLKLVCPFVISKFCFRTADFKITFPDCQIYILNNCKHLNTFKIVFTPSHVKFAFVCLEGRVNSSVTYCAENPFDTPFILLL